MKLTNGEVKNLFESKKILRDMRGDGYYPKECVQDSIALLLNFCLEIEAAQVDPKEPLTQKKFLELSHAATEKINDLQEKFNDMGSEIETMARESFGDAFFLIAKAYGFGDIDVEELISPRDW